MRVTVLTILFIVLVCLIFGQSKADLQKQRADAEKNIAFTNELLKAAERGKQDTYNQLILLNSRIEQRKLVINSISDEIRYLDRQIEIHHEVIIGLESDLAKLKADYARIIYHMAKHQSPYQKIMFVLASENFNTAYKRFKYMQQYTLYRRQQAKNIEEAKLKLSEAIVQLELLRSSKEKLLAEQRGETHKLEREKQDQNSTYQNLTKQEKELRKRLKEQQQLAEKLKKEIERIIAEEVRLAAERAKKSNKTVQGVFSLTPEEKLIADIFEKNKAKLPWPTDRGVITSSFGEHPHPVIKGVTIRNDGVDINTYSGAQVRSIYDGVVSRVFVIPGANKTVIIRHGNYLTVYSNLQDVFVKQGDKVSIKQPIGIVYTDPKDNTKSVIQFQIWRENEKLNPQFWLASTKNDK
jgi:murein hydrolase activator